MLFYGYDKSNEILILNAVNKNALLRMEDHLNFCELLTKFFALIRIRAKSFFILKNPRRMLRRGYFQCCKNPLPKILPASQTLRRGRFRQL